MKKLQKLLNRKDNSNYDESSLQVQVKAPADHLDSSILTLLYLQKKGEKTQIPFNCKWFLKSADDMDLVGQSNQFQPMISDIGKVLSYQLQPNIENRIYEGMPLSGVIGPIYLANSYFSLLDNYMQNSFTVSLFYQGKETELNLSRQGSRFTVDKQLIFQRAEWWPKVNLHSRLLRHQLVIIGPDKASYICAANNTQNAQLSWILTRCFRGECTSVKQGLSLYKTLASQVCVQIDMLDQLRQKLNETYLQLRKQNNQYKEQQIQLKNKISQLKEHLNACSINFFDMEKQHKTLKEKHSALQNKVFCLQNQIDYFNKFHSQTKNTQSVISAPKTLRENDSDVVESMLVQSRRQISELFSQRQQYQRQLQQTSDRLRMAENLKESLVSENRKLQSEIVQASAKNMALQQQISHFKAQLLKETRLKQKEKSKTFEFKSMLSKNGKYKPDESQSLRALANKLVQTCTQKDILIQQLKLTNKELMGRLNRMIDESK